MAIRSGSSWRARGVGLVAVATLVLAPITIASASTAKRATAQSSFKCSGAPSTVNVGLNGTPGAAFGPDVQIYSQIGYIERVCHTTLNLEYFGSGTAAQAALVGGSVQFLYGGGASQIAGIIQGAASNVVALSASSQGGSSLYVASTKYKGNGVGINALAKFASVSWGVPSTNGTGAIYNAAIFRAAKITPSSVNLVVVGNNAAPALAGGQVQLAVSAPSALEPLLLTGQYYTVWFSSGLQAYRLEGLISGSQLLTTSQEIAQDPSLVQAFEIGTVKAITLLRKDAKNPAAIYDTYPAAAQAAIPYAVFLAGWAPSRAQLIPLTGLWRVKDIQRLANIDANYGIITQQVTIPKYAADDTFLLKAYKILGLPEPTSPVDSSELYWLNEKNTGISGA
jgi:ABC-type nitrate/sulfonate/bicarbonate transport system substrate-binding protein